MNTFSKEGPAGRRQVRVLGVFWGGVGSDGGVIAMCDSISKYITVNKPVYDSMSWCDHVHPYPKVRNPKNYTLPRGLFTSSRRS